MTKELWERLRVNWESEHEQYQIRLKKRMKKLRILFSQPDYKKTQSNVVKR